MGTKKKEEIEKEKRLGKKTKVGLLYLGLHHQLIKKYGCGQTITRKEFFCKIGKHYMIPKDLRHWIVKEMKKAKLIEKVNRDNIKILSFDIDIEKDKNQLGEILNV